MAISAGSVAVRVVPTAQTFAKDLQAQILPKVRVIGTEIGKEIAAGIGQGIGDPLSGPLDDSSKKQQSKAPRQGEVVAGAFARGFQNRLKAAFAALPKAKIDADSSAADRTIADLRARMEALSGKTIGVDIDEGQALAELAALQAELDALDGHESIQVRVDAAAAAAELAAVQAEVDRLDGETATVRANADVSGAMVGLGTLAASVGAVAAIPLGATLGAGILSLIGPLGAVGVGFGGLAAVAVPAITHVKDALQAQKQAAMASAAGAAQAQGRALAEAGAQQQLASAVRNAAVAHQQALQAVRAAEQQLTQAQQSAANAQRALNRARLDAQRQLQDMANQVADAQLAVRQSTFDVADAQRSYNKVVSDPKATQDQIARAKLALDQARQQQREQQLTLKRLRADQKAADKAGVDGSNAVRSARQQLTAANEQVANSERALAAARANVARADQASADQIASARRAVTLASLQGAGANSKLAASMAALTPAERRLMSDWKGLTKAFSGWAKALEPDVLPLFSKGIDLVRRGLPLLTPAVHGAAGAVGGLLDDVGKAASSPFWRRLTDNVTRLIPTAVTSLGHSTGNVATGIAGIVNAFLPYAPAMLRFIEQVSQRFADWGVGLEHTQQFADFMAYVQRVAPLVAHDVVEIAKAAGHVVSVLSTFGPPLLGGVSLLANLVSKMPPSLLEAIALGWLAIAASQKAIAVGQGTKDLLGAVGFLSKGGDAASKGIGGLSRTVLGLGEGATRVRPSLITLAAEEDGVAASASRAKLALAGLGGVLFTVGAIVLASPLAKKLHDELNGTSQDTGKLAEALGNLGKSGKFNGALLKEFKGNVIGTRDSLQTLQADAKELVSANIGQYVSHSLNQMFSWLPGVGNRVGELRGKFKGLDSALTQMVNSGQGQQAAAAFAQISTQLSKAGVSTSKINSLFPAYTRLVGSAAFQNQQLGQQVAQATQKINSENAALSRSAHEFAGNQQELINFQQGLAGATAGLQANGRAFFGNSAQAIDNRSRVLSVAQTLQGYSDDLVANNNVTGKNVARLKSQRDQLVDVAAKFLGSKKKAQEYIDKLVKIPKSVKTKLDVAATGQFQMKGVSYTSNPFNLPGRAGGGLLNGPGSDRSDSILTRVSRNEFIVNAPATRKYLPLLAAINDEGNQGTPYTGKGYAGGGLVGASVIPAFAGGGILDTGLLSAKTVLSGKLKYVYSGLGSAYGEALTKAAAGVKTGANESNEFSVKQTALAAAVALGLFGGGSSMVDLARTQIGYREGAGNSNKYSHALGRPSEEWCADFINWLALKTGNKSAIPWTASAPGMANAFGNKYRSGTSGAAPGDVLFFGSSKGGIYHVGLASGPGGGGAVPTIAGNSGNAVRAYTGTGIAGYAHPSYLNPGSGLAAPGSLVRASPTTAKAWARQSLKTQGWSQDQFSPLERLWTRESGWRWNALNRASGAYGIPQSLPASKMRSAGSDWHDNAGTQIKWGLGYIRDRYGSPAGAWAHSQRTGWYDEGGWLPPGPSLVYNGTGRPEPVLSGKQWDSLRSTAGGREPKEIHVMQGARVELREPVDVDMLANRLDFAARSASF